jgi:hypothetical protein
MNSIDDKLNAIPVKVTGVDPLTGEETLISQVVNTSPGESSQGQVVRPTETYFPTFFILASAITIAQNKSMLSIVNAGGSPVRLRIRQLKIVNAQTTAVTGVVANFNLFRITGHSGGTLITPLSADTSDVIEASVTVRTGATVAGEAANALMRWLYSSDEWGVGAADVESVDHTSQTLNKLIDVDRYVKPVTLRAGEGISIKQTTNSTNGSFDILFIVTQES